MDSNYKEKSWTKMKDLTLCGHVSLFTGLRVCLMCSKILSKIIWEDISTTSSVKLLNSVCVDVRHKEQFPSC